MKCKDHPRYKGTTKPKANCEGCWKMYIMGGTTGLSESIHMEADVTNEILIPDYIKDFIPKHTTVIAIAYKTDTGAFRLQQRLVIYASPSDIAALLDRMKQGVKDIDGEFLAMSVCKLKEVIT